MDVTFLPLDKDFGQNGLLFVLYNSIPLDAIFFRLLFAQILPLKGREGWHFAHREIELPRRFAPKQNGCFP
jgi:hypothetical protein